MTVPETKNRGYGSQAIVRVAIRCRGPAGIFRRPYSSTLAVAMVRTVCL